LKFAALFTCGKEELTAENTENAEARILEVSAAVLAPEQGNSIAANPESKLLRETSSRSQSEEIGFFLNSLRPLRSPR